MSSPLSGKGTLDKTIGYCQYKHISTTESSEYPRCSALDRGKVVAIDRFVFQAHSHSTGCGVYCWVISDDDDAYNIINTTYWYSSSYTFNDSRWEHGAWDEALTKAIIKLEKLVDEHKSKVIHDKEIYQAKKDIEAQERKSKFEAYFVPEMKEPSTRCGKGSCEHYAKDNQVSKCSMFDDRNMCASSKKQRRKAAAHSSRQRVAQITGQCSFNNP